MTIFDGDRIPDAAEPPVVASVDPNAADCRAGSLLACDNLRSSPVPEYVQYGTKCGDRNIEVGSCVTTYGANQLPPPSDSASIGRDPGLDQLVPECQSGDAAACNGLRTKANSGTGYSALGLTCGGTRNADSTDCPTTPTPASTEALSTESETVATRAITLDSAPATTAPITVVLTNPPATPTTTVSIIPVRTDPSPATTTQHVESVPPTNPVAVSTVPIDPQDAALLTQAVGVLEATTPTVNWQADKVTVGKQTDVNVVVDTSHLQAGQVFALTVQLAGDFDAIPKQSDTQRIRGGSIASLPFTLTVVPKNTGQIGAAVSLINVELDDGKPGLNANFPKASPTHVTVVEPPKSSWQAFKDFITTLKGGVISLAAFLVAVAAIWTFFRPRPNPEKPSSDG